MADMSPWVPFLSSLAGGIASLIGTFGAQWFTFRKDQREREAKEEADRRRKRDEFQLNNLMGLQKVISIMTTTALTHLLAEGGKQASLSSRMRLLNRCEMLSERALDEDLRRKVKKAIETSAVALIVKRDKPDHSGAEDLRKTANEAERRLGELLRALM